MCLYLSVGRSVCLSVCLCLQPGDGEIYRASTFFKARSFRIGLVFSLLLVILIIIVVIVVPVAVVGTLYCVLLLMVCSDIGGVGILQSQDSVDHCKEV